MSNTRVVHGDAKGLRINTNGAVYRPGDVEGYSHMYPMDEHGLKIGDKVKCTPLDDSPLVRLKLSDGDFVYWHVEHTEVESSTEDTRFAKTFSYKQLVSMASSEVDGGQEPSESLRCYLERVAEDISVSFYQIARKMGVPDEVFVKDVAEDTTPEVEDDEDDEREV